MAKQQPKQKPTWRLERSVERVKHKFCDDETIVVGHKLNQSIRALKDVQDEKKSVASDYAAREKALNVEIDRYSRLMQQGFEMRDKVCAVLKDFKNGRVYYFLAEELEGIDPTKYKDGEYFLEFLLSLEGINPVKKRRLEDHERQTSIFDEPEKNPANDDQKTEVVTS